MSLACDILCTVYQRLVNPKNCGRCRFSWLKNPEKAVAFFADLGKFLTSLPVTGIAAIIDRPGYIARYVEKYAGEPWLMDKTAYAILVERAAKFVRSKALTLRIFYEESGKDTRILR